MLEYMTCEKHRGSRKKGKNMSPVFFVHFFTQKEGLLNEKKEK